jgi:hypothetical protein
MSVFLAKIFIAVLEMSMDKFVIPHSFSIAFKGDLADL